MNAYLYATFDFVTALALPMTMGLMVVAGNVAPYFFGNGFKGIDRVIILEAPVILIIAWSNVLGVQYLLPTKQTRAYTISVILGALVNVVTNVPLIQLWGTRGPVSRPSCQNSRLPPTSYGGCGIKLKWAGYLPAAGNIG
ncbi:lipopolysaccharide biosynthesis protein [Lactiplantibacillus carotarum]|nr:polysaccharide biosynthesis C-terminal domain-containing protein [Lactiplantibacillus carotarum]